MFVYTRADNHLLCATHVRKITRRQRYHEMNMSALCVNYGTLKPGISHFYSFVLSLLFQLANIVFFFN